MNKLKLLLIGLTFCLPLVSQSQRAITPDDLAGWKRITQQIISDDGKWVACKIAPWEGDATIRLFKSKGGEVATYTPAGAFEFSSSSQYLLVTLVPGKVTANSLKLKKVKKEKMPLNSLLIRHLSGREEVIDSINSYKLAKSGDWIAYKRHRKDSTLHVRSLDGKSHFQYPAVSDYQFAKKSNTLFCISKGDTLGAAPGIYTLQPDENISTLIKEGEGRFEQTAIHEKGGLLAFLYCEEKDSVYKNLSLWLSEENKIAHSIAKRGDKAFPEEWVISEYGKVHFSENGKRVFFGTAPIPVQEDSTVLAESRPQVEVWSWNEHTQYTVRKHEKENILKKNYQAMYDIEHNVLRQLANKEFPDIVLGNEGNSEHALLSTNLSYPTVAMWEGSQRKDYYILSLADGAVVPLKKNISDRVRLSPGGKYAWWYAERDSSWYAVALEENRGYRLTDPRTFIAWDEDNDLPDYPSAHGAAGWSANDEYLLLYDRYDIWRIDPRNAKPMVNLTVNGRSNKLTYRLVQLDAEERWIDTGKTSVLHVFNEKTKGGGYCTTRLSMAKTPKVEVSGDYKFANLLKARKADGLLFTKESFEYYPELYSTTLAFGKPVQLTNEGVQQQEFLWGTAELVSWTSIGGIPLEGIVCKPANFDPKKKYPLIVNFYERSSKNLHSYRTPEPHRSTVDYHMYNSNEYIIFNPDVRFRDGYPGESCFNCVMPGISMLIEKGYINEKAIAAQGHSWGGYQVAYLATRTPLFAAIESGAPVVNMFSAYGGIRWGSGRNRSFQYEHGQSRIGATPWSAPLKYIENSPLFTMDKVQTPILIMHNDQDGHVPWYQGIEYFIALKRLQKPVWLLNYTGEIHWPSKIPNRVDFQTKMFQFFNHYLKQEPMPEWMEEIEN